MPDVKIQTTKNGPYVVTGPVELVDSEGRSFTLNKPLFALCRCGGSTNKPFCDGTHSKLGFQAAEAAVAAAESK